MENSGYLKTAVDRNSIGKGLLYTFLLFCVRLKLCKDIDITERIVVATNRYKHVTFTEERCEHCLSARNWHFGWFCSRGHEKYTSLAFPLATFSTCRVPSVLLHWLKRLMQETRTRTHWRLCPRKTYEYRTGWTQWCRKGVLDCSLQIIQVCSLSLLSFTQ